MAIDQVARVFRIRHPKWKIARAVLLLAAIPFFLPGIVNVVIPASVFPEAATRFVFGALLLAPLGAAIEWALEHLTHRLYRYHWRKGFEKKPKITTREQLHQYASTRAQFMGGFIHALTTNLAYLVLTATVLFSAASAVDEDARHELVGVVLSSIAGNLVVNILFVLGVATVIGGLVRKGIPYDKDVANAYSEMLTLAIIILGLPTLAYQLNLSLGLGEAVFKLPLTDTSRLSDITAAILLIVFVGYFLYTVVGFRASEISESSSQTGATPLRREASAGLDATESSVVAVSANQEQPRSRGLLAFLKNSLRLPVLLLIILIFGIAIVVVSEQMAGALEEGLGPGGFFVEKATFIPGVSLNAFFVGFILLPIATHIAEVFAAISMTTHVEETNLQGEDEPRLETCHGITVGASIQVVLLVAPLLLLLGHIFGVTEMNLIFSPFLLAVFVLMVFLLQVNVFDGKTDWLEGMEMVAFFALLSVVAFLATPVTG